MESKLKQYGISEMTTNPQDYISRKDHARISDSRVSAREADLQVSLLPPVHAPKLCSVGSFVGLHCPEALAPKAKRYSDVL